MNELYLLVAVVVVLGAGAWFVLSRRGGQRTIAEARREAEKLVADAERESQTKLREAEVAAKEKLLQARSEFEKVSGKRRAEIEAIEERLTQREEKLEKRLDEIVQREVISSERVQPPPTSPEYMTAKRSGEASYSEFIESGKWEGYTPPPLPEG